MRSLAHRIGADAVAGAMALLGTDDRSADNQALIAELARTPSFLPTGKDVLALGVNAGPKVGQVLDVAREAWIEAGCPAGRDEQMAIVARAVSA